jgi:hypothetical protein
MGKLGGEEILARSRSHLPFSRNGKPKGDPKQGILPARPKNSFPLSGPCGGFAYQSAPHGPQETKGPSFLIDTYADYQRNMALPWKTGTAQVICLRRRCLRKNPARALLEIHLFLVPQPEQEIHRLE